VDRVDRRVWRLETSSEYTVRSAYNFLSATTPVDNVVPVSSLWHKNVPLNVVVFAGRLFQDRLPTKNNLFRRHVITIDARSCVGECGKHLLTYFYIVISLDLFEILFSGG